MNRWNAFTRYCRHSCKVTGIYYYETQVMAMVEHVANMYIKKGVAYETATRYDLIPVEILRALAEVYTYGAKKCADNTWQQLDDFNNRYYAALMRHVEAWRAGEYIDTESQLPTLAHAMWCAGALLWGTLPKKNEEVGNGENIKD